MKVESKLYEPDTQSVSSPKSHAVAYLVSQYPMLSMIFILREVVQLRDMGFRIDVASINYPDRLPKDLTKIEAAEAENAYCIKKHGVFGAAVSHIRTLFTNFTGYGRGLFMAFRLGRLDLERLAFNFVYFTEALMVGAWMHRMKHRHLHVHLGSQAASVGMYVRNIFGVGFSMTVHGPDEFFDVQGQYLGEKVASADFVCCISDFARSQLMRCSPYEHWRKLVVCRLGVDPKLFSPVSRCAEPDIYEVLCVGRLTPAKGQHLLIDAVERLIDKGWKVRLRVVGGGTDETSLKKRASEIRDQKSVIFEGAVNQDHIRSLYRTADIFCIASFAEGIPVVLMEAMAMEIPCVSTNIAGIPELIRDGIDGLLIAPSDLDGLVEALIKLMRDADFRKRISKSGRTRVLERYDLRLNVQSLGEVFAERIHA